MFRPSFRLGSALFAGICLLVVINSVLLGRIESAVSVPWGGLVWSPLILAGGGIFGLALLSRGRLPPYSLTVLGIGLLAVAVTALNLGFRGSPVGPALYGLSSFVFPMLLCPSVASLPHREARRLRGFVGIILVALALVVVVSVLASAGVSGALGWDSAATRGMSPIGGPIATGAVLMLVWPLILSRVIERPGARSVLVFAVVAVAIVLSGSRLIVLAAAVSLVAVVALGWGRIRTRRKLLNVGFASLLIVVGAIMIVQWSTNLPAGARIVQLVSEASDGQRVQSLITGLRLIADAPVTGHGPGTVYPWMDPAWSTDGRPGMVPTSQGYSLVEPHNTYVMAAAEYGLIWAAMALLLLGTASLRALRGGGRDADLTYSSLGIVAFMLQAVGSSHLFVNPRVAILFWIWLGACLALEGSERRGRRPGIQDREGLPSKATS